ncbi:MAG: CD225/dispanin family protein [Planctomycetota bacterium]|nr:CD225/dispanin family protein [Planctomycetota bacterium]
MASQEKVDNPLGKAVLSLLICQPFGIVAIIHVLNVNARINKGDIEGAKESAEKANFWANIAIGLGGIGVVLTVVANLVAFFSRT